MKPEEFHACKNTFLPSEADEMCSGEDPEGHNVTGKVLKYAEHPGHCHQNQTLQQVFEFSGQQKDFSKEAVVFTHRRAPVGGTAYKCHGHWEGCDNSALTAQRELT